jgi:hypothetical protein
VSERATFLFDALFHVILAFRREFSVSVDTFHGCGVRNGNHWLYEGRGPSNCSALADSPETHCRLCGLY